MHAELAVCLVMFCTDEKLDDRGNDTMVKDNDGDDDVDVSMENEKTDAPGSVDTSTKGKDHHGVMCPAHVVQWSKRAMCSRA